MLSFRYVKKNKFEFYTHPNEINEFLQSLAVNEIKHAKALKKNLRRIIMVNPQSTIARIECGYNTKCLL